MSVPIVLRQQTPGKLAGQQIFQTSEGRLGFGITNPISPIEVVSPRVEGDAVLTYEESAINIRGNSDEYPRIGVFSYGAIGHAELAGLAARGTRLLPTNTASSDVITTFYGRGYHSTFNDHALVGQIQVVQSAAPVAGGHYGSMTFTVGNATDQYSGSDIFIISANSITSRMNILTTTVVKDVIEKITIAATAATGTIAFDVLTQAVLHYTTNAAANWTVNLRGNSTTTLANVMAVGQSYTVVFLVPQGATAYYASAHQIDGNAVTPLWLGNLTPSAGHINSTDVYTYTIIKTAATPTYTVLASLQQFA